MSEARVLHGWLIAIAIVLLAGCASPAAVPASGASRQWQGRFALTMTEPGVEQTTQQVQGRFSLRRIGEHEHLEVASPFGQTMAVLESAPGSASLRTSDGQRLEARSADALLEQALGWRLPVEALSQWLLAGPLTPVPPSGDWLIEIQSRFEDGYPRVLDARWPAEPKIGTREMKARIVVDSP